MPFAALKPCSASGCPTLTTNGRCAIHAKQQDKQRGSATARGYDHQWHLYTISFKQQHPFCGERADGSMDTLNSRCARDGKLTPVQCVDHTIPMSQGGSKWDEANHMASCYACNSWKAKTLER